ncbi:hypothetical protein OOT00_14685 [Desulfobotulus sp. H1]|uniref:Rubredoxin-like domain-containing protein n=1 Tax=Desulfobotulus pelophilus TaxID=2823377 RepID=A0ABT3NCN3_9BACT|nr:DUF2231 domain-containing protein [Desulfobotulus pelophilus]MCW7755232.1 hypothetical protein [Desulfobotulus pelophilus]
MQEWICTVCGYTHHGTEAPDTCPVCGASKAVFEATAAETTGQNAKDAEKKEQNPTTSRWRCTVCGYIHEGEEPPDICPLCGADRSAFEPADSADPEKEPENESKRPFSTGATPSLQGNPREWVDEQILLHHAHPISVHIPNGVLPIAVFFAFIGILFNAQAFKLAAYFNMTMVFLALPVVLYTGFVEWRGRYRSAMTSIFRTKIFCAAVATICVSIIVIWRSFSSEAEGFFYFLLHLVALGAIGIAGHLGGKLVFGKRG